MDVKIRPEFSQEFLDIIEQLSSLVERAEAVCAHLTSLLEVVERTGITKGVSINKRGR